MLSSITCDIVDIWWYDENLCLGAILWQRDADHRVSKPRGAILRDFWERL